MLKHWKHMRRGLKSDTSNHTKRIGWILCVFKLVHQCLYHYKFGQLKIITKKDQHVVQLVLPVGGSWSERHVSLPCTVSLTEFLLEGNHAGVWQVPGVFTSFGLHLLLSQNPAHSFCCFPQEADCSICDWNVVNTIDTGGFRRACARIITPRRC